VEFESENNIMNKKIVKFTVEVTVKFDLSDKIIMEYENADDKSSTELDRRITSYSRILSRYIHTLKSIEDVRIIAHG
jgi:hypothetical protein